MKSNKISVLSTLIMLVVAFILAVGTVSAAGTEPNIEIIDVEINDIDNIDSSNQYSTQYKRGETLDINVKLLSRANIDDVEVEVEINGDEHHDIEVETEQFDVSSNTYYYKSLSLDLPDDLEQDTYLLTVRVSARGFSSVEESFFIKIDTNRHDVIIKDIDFSSNPVKAGRGLEATVRVKNVGEKDEDQVRIGFEIPELGLKAADAYMDDLDDDESRSSEPLYIRIPECTGEGTYTAVFTVEFDDGYKTVIETQKIQILEGDSCMLSSVAMKTTTILLGADTQVIEKGKTGVVCPITIKNEGIATRQYTISTTGLEEWADVEVSPSNVAIIEAGKSQIISVYVTAKDGAQNGEKAFTVNVQSGTGTAEPIPLSATVTGKDSSSWDAIKKGLEVGLVILLVLLIVLGVIVAFNRMKGEKTEDVDEEIVDVDAKTPVEDYSTEESYY